MCEHEKVQVQTTTEIVKKRRLLKIQLICPDCGTPFRFKRNQQLDIARGGYELTIIIEPGEHPSITYF